MTAKWLKNLITLGGYNRLEENRKTYKEIARTYNYAKERYFILDQNRYILYFNLELERKEAIRNIELVKTILLTMKTVKSSEIVLNNDNLSYSLDILEKDLSPPFSTLGIVSIDFQNKATISLLNSIDNLNKKAADGVITKKDLKTEGIIFGAQLIGSAIDSTLDFNRKVNEENATLVENINLMNSELPEMLLQSRNYYGELKRMEEIANSLIFFNEKFSNAYKNFIEKYYKKYNIKKIDAIKNSDFQADLNFLQQICKEYSTARKVNITR